MTPQVELSEPQGVSMPEVTAKHSQADKDLNPFNTASVTAKYAQETNAAYTDKKNFLSSEKMNEERLYDPQTVAGQMAAVSEGRKVYGVTGLISAKNIVVTGDDIDNDGVIMAGKANIKGKYVRNKGIVAGGSLSLDAQGNLTVTGKISGEENVSLTGQKVDIHSTTVNFQTQNTVKQVAGGNTAASGTRNNQYGERPRYNGAIIHTKYGFFKVIDGSDVYMEEVPDGIYFWNQDEENSQYGWDFHRKDGVDYYYPNKIEWSIYKNVDGVAYGVVLVRESDYERKLILQKAGKMFIESMIYGSGNEVARDLMEEINNGSINAWNAAKTIFSKYQDIFVEFFKK